MVNHIDIEFQNDADNFPAGYKNLLSNLSKATSVSGFLQVTRPDTLRILEDYCDQLISLRSPEHNDDLKLVMAELPALWPDLLDILNRLDSTYLPLQVSAIVKKLIEIRRNIFINSPDRYSADYFEYEWDEVGEHSTQFWPNWEILTYPKKYNVRNVKDEDLCNKEFRQSSKHPAGLFSGGCPHNITLGFELTLNQESPHNLFRLLQCRDLDISRLKGLYFSL